MQGLEAFAAFAEQRCRARVHAKPVPLELFDGWVLGRWSKIAYYRLLAPVLLPETVDRIFIRTSTS